MYIYIYIYIDKPLQNPTKCRFHIFDMGSHP